MASCEKDDFLEKELQTGSYPIKYSTKTYQELANNTAFTSTFTALRQHFDAAATSLQARGSYMEEEYGFSIDSSVVEVAKTDKYTSYTMYISRAEHPKHYFENLVIEVTDTAKTKAYVVQYFPTSPIKPVPEHNSYTFGYDFNFIPIKYNEGSKADAGGCEPITIIICTEEFGAHFANDSCVNQEYITTYTIGGSCGGGSSDGGSGNPDGGNGNPAGYPNNPSSGNNSGPSYPYNPGGSGGSGGPNNQGNTSITNPLLCYKTQVDCPPELEYWDALKDPCESLEELANENGQDITSQIEFLQQKLNNNTNNEWGVELKRTENPDGSFANNNTQVEGSANGVSLIAGWEYIGACHLHTDDGYPMFSFGDLHQLSRFYSLAAAYNQPYVTSILVANNPANENNPNENPFLVYAIKAENPNLLIQAVENMLNNPELNSLTVKEKISIINDKLRKPYSNSENNLEAYFLQLFSSFGIELYKADEALENWNQLSLNGTTIEEKPCE